MPLLWVILILEVSWTVRNTLVVFYTMFKRLSLKIRAYFLFPRDKLLDCLFRSPEMQWPKQPAAGWRAPCAMGGRCGAQGNEKKYENCYYLYLQWKYCMADNSIQSSLLFILHYIFWTKPTCNTEACSNNKIVAWNEILDTAIILCSQIFYFFFSYKPGLEDTLMNVLHLVIHFIFFAKRSFTSHKKTKLPWKEYF